MIVWYRRDLRFDDHSPLKWASDSGDPILPLFIYDPSILEPWALGSARKWWLFRSLESFSEQWKKRGGHLVYREGKTKEILLEICKKTGIKKIVAHAHSEPTLRELDRLLQVSLNDRGIELILCAPPVLHNFEKLKNKSGGNFLIFTPFWKAFWDQSDTLSPPVSSPPMDIGKKTLKFPSDPVTPKLFLKPTRSGNSWWESFEKTWDVSELAAQKNLKKFLDDKIQSYAQGRNNPTDDKNTSRISPYLHGGEISPRRVWFEIIKKYPGKKIPPNVEQYLKEIVWREFGAYCLFHNPQSDQKSLKLPYEKLKWTGQDSDLARWQKGLTGFPIVDAGMRQLWQTGWMHNRVRMIVASFLVKDLLIPWQKGAEWFWDTLVDADLGSNTLGWQWTAGCGVDAAPYFRIFNPILQGEKFDPNGEYVKKFLPELKNTPTAFIHKPWESPNPPKNYPAPVVDHAVAREKILKLFSQLKKI